MLSALKDTYKFNCDFNSLDYYGQKLQTYSIGSGERTVFSFPAFPHSGLIYLFFLLGYDLKNTRFITFDLPGWIGMSEDRDKTAHYDINRNVEIAKYILKQYGVKNYSVLGFSFGGALTLKLASIDQNRINKIAVVSPVVNATIAQHSSDIFKIRVADKLHLYPFINLYVKSRYNKYRKVLEKNGIPLAFLSMYKQLVDNADSYVLLKSIANLFTDDCTEQCKYIDGNKLMVISSKDETPYLRKQSEYLRRLVHNEESLYLRGNHEDFILFPKKDVVKKVVDFLTN